MVFCCMDPMDWYLHIIGNTQDDVDELVVFLWVDFRMFMENFIDNNHDGRGDCCKNEDFFFFKLKKLCECLGHFFYVRRVFMFLFSFSKFDNLKTYLFDFSPNLNCTKCLKMTLLVHSLGKSD